MNLTSKRIPLAAAILSLLSACGTGSSSSGPGISPHLTIQSISVPDGGTWQVNRPIEITFDRPIHFGSVHSGSIQIVDSAFNPAGGQFSQPPDASGVIQTNKLVFRPSCPLLADGSDAGFAPGGTRYVLTLFGTDQPGLAILPLSGEALAQTTSIEFFTPTSTAPSILYHDPVAGPPAVRLRGTSGVSITDLDATHLELSATPTGRAYFHYNFQSGIGTLTAADMALIGDGLPRNHYSVPENQIGFMFVFNQSVHPDPINLEKLRVEHLSVTWKPLAGQIELVKNCTTNGNGALLRFQPKGLLPPGTSLRMVVETGFQDLSGQATLAPYRNIGTALTTFSTSGSAVSVDGILENFALSGDAPGSLEDTEATFPVPNAVWDGGIVYPVFGTNGQSKTRSKWIPLGLGHLNPGGPETTPDFIFGGTNSNGAIPVVGGLVDPIADVSAPIPLLGLEPQAITIPLAELMTLGEVYLAQPALLQGFRVQISPTGQSGIGPKATIVSTSLQGNGLRIQLGEGCGYGIGDCVPLDLTLTYPGPTGLTAVIEPRFFEVATRFVPDMLPPDSRITILFDATMADAAGQPDPTAALSTISGWHADMGDLSGTGWDFVRFEIFFEMDVSGDGWGLFDPLPSLRWLSFGFDQRL